MPCTVGWNASGSQHLGVVGEAVETPRAVGLLGDLPAGVNHAHLIGRRPCCGRHHITESRPADINSSPKVNTVCPIVDTVAASTNTVGRDATNWPTPDTLVIPFAIDAAAWTKLTPGS